MDSRLTLHVSPVLAPVRLDVFLAQQVAALSRRQVRELIGSGAVRVNGRVARKGQSLTGGDVVSACVPVDAAGAGLIPEPTLPVRILYEDDDILALDKPAGMATVALRITDRGTVANFLIGYDSACAAASPNACEAGLVHRLDTDTSGVVLAARTAAAYQALRDQFRRQTVIKNYVAVVAGDVRDAGVVSVPIAHAPHNARRMCVPRSPEQARTLRARAATTRFQPLQRGRSVTLLTLQISTGVRHQIRVHLASIGHPIVGDRLYSGTDDSTPRLLLHARRVRIRSPDGGPLDVHADVPHDFGVLLRHLGLNVPSFTDG